MGIRNRRPSTPGLAGQKLGPVAFAVFGPPALTREWSAADEQSRYGNFNWVAFRTAGSTVPSAAWLDRRLTRPPIVRLSDPRAVLDASAAGIGLCVLPCFVGDSDRRLRRASGVIDDLTHEQWLVSHDDHRHNRPVRQITDRIKRLMKERRRLFAGAVPIGVRTD
ncbi:MAG: hypothetical protein HKM95_07825 [Inquilinus sp.]|nr:hypothetical protein [Inquilinus sp.]